MAGFIYVMSNPAFPHLIKIGKTKKDPTQDRVSELNQTGVPEPFQVEYYAFVENEDALEHLTHQHFSAQRPNMKREFFNLDCAFAINTIRDLAMRHSPIKFEEVFYISPDEITAEQEKTSLEAESERARLEAEKAERKLYRNLEAQAQQERERDEAEKVEEERKKPNAWERLFLFFVCWLFLLKLFMAVVDWLPLDSLNTPMIFLMIGMPTLICCALWWLSVLGRR